LVKIETAIAERLSQIRAVIFDMDGTLVVGDAKSGVHEALPGAARLLRLLRRRNIPFRVFTNGTAKTPSSYAANLRNVGLDVDDAEMMTPSTAAAVWFVQRRLRRIRVLGLEGVQEPLRKVGLEVISPSAADGNVEAVFTGWFREFTFPDLEAACRDIWASALLTTASNVPFFATKDGRAIGVSFAINAMIQSMTGAELTILGKPAPEAFHCALKLMGLPAASACRTVVVGDDPALEMRMARASGALAVGVTTGLTDNSSFAKAAPSDRPDIVFDGLDKIIEALD
jgi:HAD superfamily hydrolase (TIGR01450 family)